MSGGFLRRPFMAQFEVINDLNRDIATFFRMVRHHIGALCDELEWTINSRDEFERLKQIPVDTMTDIQRSARYLIMRKMRFMGKPKSGTFKASPNGKAQYRA